MLPVNGLDNDNRVIINKLINQTGIHEHDFITIGTENETSIICSTCGSLYCEKCGKLVMLRYRS